MNQGFAPSPLLESTLARTPHGAPRVPHTAHTTAHAPHQAPHVPSANASEVAGKSAVVASNATQPQLTKEQKQASNLQNVKNVFMAPAQMEFFGMLGGGLLAGLTRKFNWQRVTAVIGMVLQAPVRAMRTTTILESLRLPGNIFKDAGQEASKAGDKAAGLAKAAQNQSETMLKSAHGAEERISSMAAPHIANFGKAIDKFEATGLGKSVHGAFDSVMHNRQAASVTKHTKAFDKAQQALTTEAVGFGKSVTNFFTRAKPATVNAGELSSVMHGLNASKSLSGAKKVKHLNGVMQDLEKILANDAIKGEVKSRAGKVAKHVQEVLGSAHALETYEHAAGGNLKTIIGAVGKAVGRVPVFNALLGVGIVAGIGSVLVTSKGESKASKEAFESVKKELANHPDSDFLKIVKAQEKKGKAWGMAKTGLNVVGEGLDGLMWTMTHGGGMGMMGAVMLPNLCTMLIPENASLGALVALDKAEKGQVTLQPDDRVQIYKHLVGIMPAVAANGGVYNHLAGPIAAAIEEKHLSRSQLIQLFGDNQAFSKLASDVSAKLEAEKATVSKANDNAPAAPKTALTASANDDHKLDSQTALEKAEAAYALTEKPDHAATNGIQLAGRVTAAERRLA